MQFTLTAPAGINQFQSSNGNSYQVSTAGTIKVPLFDLDDALKNGFTLQATPTSKMQMLATRCGLNHAFQLNTGQPGYASRIQHCLPYGAKSLAFLYAAFYVTSPSSDTDMPSPGGFGWSATAGSVGNNSGGSYAPGDFFAVTVPTNSFPVICQVDAVSTGAVTLFSVVDPGGLAAVPGANLATTKITGSGNNALTVNLTVQACAFPINVALEQSWGNQAAVSSSNPSGVVKMTRGLNISGGAVNINLPFSQPILTDLANVNLPAGQLIGSRLYTPSTGFYPGRRILGSGTLNEYAATNVTLANNTPAGGTYGSTAFPTTAFQPIAIMGIPLVPGPSFAIPGDSIGNGSVSTAGGGTSNDSLDANGNGGFIERAINQTYPCSKFCTPGDALTNWLSQSAASMRWQMLVSCSPSHVIDQLGINDLINGDSYATFRSKKIAFWNRLLGLGVKEIWATTMTMNTTSTNGWATTDNQTVTAANAAIQAYNRELRNGFFSKYVTRVIDLGTAVETTIGSGIWPAGSTADGLHPTQAQTAVIAAAVTPQLAGATL